MAKSKEYLSTLREHEFFFFPTGKDMYLYVRQVSQIHVYFSIFTGLTFYSDKDMEVIRERNEYVTFADYERNR